MPEMTPEARQQFEELHTQGLQAQKAGNPQAALDRFLSADELAKTADDERKRLDALNPAAHAMWLMGDYDTALGVLTGAERIAERLQLIDEQAIAVSNMGRLAAVRTVNLSPVPKQAEELRREAVPRFARARQMLAGHGHFYFRYANAQHGSVAAALAGERREAVRLLKDGLSVAFRKSPEPYDQKRTYRISRRGLGQMATAAGLLPLGGRTPKLAEMARSRHVR